MKNYKLTLGNVRESDISKNKPIVEVVLTSPEGEARVIGYLCPFRNYRFQISETFQGEWDLGSTPVIPDLKDRVIEMREDVAVDDIEANIVWAMVNYTNTRYCREATGGSIPEICPMIADERARNKYAYAVLKYWHGEDWKGDYDS